MPKKEYTGSPRRSCSGEYGEPKCRYWTGTGCVRNFKIPEGNIKEAIQAAELGTMRPCPYSMRGQQVLNVVNQRRLAHIKSQEQQSKE